MAGTTQKVKRAWLKTLASTANNVLDPFFAFYTQINNIVTDLATTGVTNSVNTTAVSNVGTAETDLMTYALPASKLVNTGGFVKLVAWGTSANNANVKTLKAYFGTTAILTQTLTASIAGRWRIEALVLRTGLSAQDFQSGLLEGLATLGAGKFAEQVGTATETETAAITIKVTGTSGTASTDITQEGMVVEFFPTATDLVASALSDAL